MSESTTVMTVTDETFATDIEGSTGVTLVDFWAEWCGPCKLIAPIVEELADQYADQGVTVGKLDVDANPHVSARYGVRSIPSILIFKDGEHVDTVVGAVPKPHLEQKIQQHL